MGEPILSHRAIFSCSSYLEFFQEQWVIHQCECVENVKLRLIGQDDRVANKFCYSMLQQPVIICVLHEGGVRRVVIQVRCLEERMSRMRNDGGGQRIE